ncbi:MAG TPA: Flp family type IVb pilin, partial [Patescibacteria group bacterium]|nr:Flp family type IVb pilin [Patescibacteria group bacterium]
GHLRRRHREHELRHRAQSGGRGFEVVRFLRDEDGQGLVEYALIIAVIAIAVIIAMVFLQGQIQNIFSNIGNNLT